MNQVRRSGDATLGWWMLAGSVLSSLGVVAILGSETPTDVRLAVWLGMLGPLTAGFSAWLAVERAHRRRPEGVTRVMIAAFAAKMVFFGGYVALVVKAGWVRPVPFAISFVAYFIALHIVEAVRLHRLFSPNA